MDNIKFYEINEPYVRYLAEHEPLMFYSDAAAHPHARKYIATVLQINDLDYFVPLTSFKPKHEHMTEALDLVKIRDSNCNYAVINLNKMFPAPPSQVIYVDFATVADKKYKHLMMTEYRIIKFLQKVIREKAEILYGHKLRNGVATSLAKRCVNFTRLEILCRNYC